MIKKFFAWLKRLENKLDQLIIKLKTKIQMENNEVKSDIAGLRKFAKFQSLTVDAEGNYTINYSFYYTDTNGNVLQYSDNSVGVQQVQSVPVDPTLAPEAQSGEVIRSQGVYNNMLAALSTVVNANVPNAL